jgi:hypothetical protein
VATIAATRGARGPRDYAHAKKRRTPGSPILGSIAPRPRRISSARSGAAEPSRESRALLLALSTRGFRILLDQRRILPLVGVEAYENRLIVHRRFLRPLAVVVTEDSAGSSFAAPVPLFPERCQSR